MPAEKDWGWLLTLRLDEPEGTREFANKFIASFPTHKALILNRPLPTMTKSQPDPLTKEQVVADAQVALSGIPTGKPNVKTISELSLLQSLRGKSATLLLRDLTDNVDIMRLDAPLYSYLYNENPPSDMVRLKGPETSTYRTQVPQILTTDLFPSAIGPTDHTPLIAFGVWRQVELSLLVATRILTTFTITSDAHEIDLTNVPNYVLQAGDVLAYELNQGEANNGTGLDLRCSDGTRLSAQPGLTDQNGLSVALLTDLSAYARNARYRREIKIPAGMVGKTVTQYLMCSATPSAGTYTLDVSNAAILHSDGSYGVQIYDEALTPTTAVFTQGHASNAAVFTHDRKWYYGPIRGHAGVSLVTVYLGVSVLSSGYTFESSGMTVGGQPIKWVKLDLDPRVDDATITIKVDLTSSEFSENHARAMEFLHADGTYMLGQAVNAASFTAAAAVYAGFGANGYKCAGGLSAKREALGIKNGLLVHGARLDRNSDGEVTETVDEAGLHTAGATDLGRGDLNDRGLGNVISINPSQEVGNDQLYRRIVFQGAFSPNLSSGPIWLISTERSRIIDGGIDDTFNYEFIADPETLDREADYVFKRKIGLDDPLTVKVQQQGAYLELGQLVSFRAPHTRWHGLTMEVWQKQIAGLDIELMLVEHPSGAYTYVPGTKQKVDPRARYLTDYSQTTPAELANCEIVGYEVSQLQDGSVGVIARLEADANPVNITHIVFRLRDVTTNLLLPETIISVTPGQLDVQGGVTGKPGKHYDVLFYARNSGNKAGFQDGAVFQILDQTFPGRTVGPPPPGNIVMSSHLKQVTVEHDPVDDPGLGGYVVEFRRNSLSGPLIGQPHPYGTARRLETTIITEGIYDPDFYDEDFYMTEDSETVESNRVRFTLELASEEYGVTVWAKVASVDTSQNIGDFGDSENGTTLTRNVTDDYSLLSLTTPRRQTLFTFSASYVITPNEGEIFSTGLDASNFIISPPGITGIGDGPNWIDPSGSLAPRLPFMILDGDTFVVFIGFHNGRNTEWITNFTLGYW